MPTAALITLIVFISVIIVPAIIITIVKIKNTKQRLSKEINDHLIEINIKIFQIDLTVDKKIVDQYKSLTTATTKLSTKVEKNEIIVNVGSGFLKPKIITFVNGEKDNDLSNC